MSREHYGARIDAEDIGQANPCPMDRTIRQAADADYQYIGIDTTCLDIAGTVHRIKRAIPEVYAD